ncbi:hypothetical protein GP486_004012 [Trichoglossum hirsutum]|uniref:DUF159-domain-containing protein n=1 Tax=Trichoglossum hirsutum TaxID=265104 RepID=A0A9P8LC59_9PEZI|nr:hypothetical protein GP486_004012 [Trichoglossum hirsutum]
MCGRYVLALRPAEVRRQLEDSGMPVDDTPDDEATRQSYNVAPGYYELVYRADVPDWGAGKEPHTDAREAVPKKAEKEEEDEKAEEDKHTVKETKYKLQAMKWGLIPFWTKRSPDYGSMLRTINCRDDSLAENRGMWTTMKQRKRCIVICQGFYEWLKKNGGKEKIPHYVKRKDGQLMCLAGLWDCVQYEDPNPQLKFLHDRMPVILENGSAALRTWLDPNRSTWTKELQSLLKPYGGELDVYAVSKDVGKVGNNSPSFVIPVASVENKSNIKNFFANTKKVKDSEVKEKKEDEQGKYASMKKKIDEPTMKNEGRAARESPENIDATTETLPTSPRKRHNKSSDITSSPTKKYQKTAPAKATSASPRKTRSAMSNGTTKKPITGKGEGSQKITKFFG